MKLFSVFSEDGLRGKSARSTGLTLIDFASQNILRLGGNLILTRLLFPEAFGIMALVTVVMTGLRMFSDVGIRLSIIQNERGDDPLFLDTAWVMQITRGVALWLATWAMAAPVATFYEAPILEELLPVAGLAALFQGFNSTKLATANRDLMLGRITLITVVSSMLGLLVLIILALRLESVWALVVGGLVSPFCVMVMSHLMMPGVSNRFRVDPSAGGELFRFGKYIFLSTVAGFLIGQADRAVLGKYVSLEDLALYGIAIMFATLPRLVQQRLFDKVLLPLYSKRPPADSAQNFRTIARARRLVVGGSIASAAVLALLGNLMIVQLYDPRYEAAGPLLVLMSVASLPGLVIGGYGNMIVTSGNSRRYAAFIVTSAMLRTGFLLVAIMYYGIIGAALIPIVATALFYPFMLWFIWPYKGWTPKQDVLFIAMAVIIGVVALWFNYSAIEDCFERFLPL